MNKYQSTLNTSTTIVTYKIYTDAMMYLYGMLALGGIITAVGMFTGNALEFTTTLGSWGWIGIVGMFIAIVILMFSAHAAAKNGKIPLSISLYAGFTYGMGLMLSDMPNHVSPTFMVVSFVVAIGLFYVLTKIGLNIKRDITTWSNALTFGLFTAIVLNIANMLVIGSGVFYLVILAGLALIFSGLVICETKEIKSKAWEMATKGNEKSAIKIALVGSIGLYLSLLNLFVILSSMSDMSDDD